MPIYNSREPEYIGYCDNCGNTLASEESETEAMEAMLKLGALALIPRGCDIIRFVCYTCQPEAVREFREQVFRAGFSVQRGKNG